MHLCSPPLEFIQCENTRSLVIQHSVPVAQYSLIFPSKMRIILYIHLQRSTQRHQRLSLTLSARRPKFFCIKHPAVVSFCGIWTFSASCPCAPLSQRICSYSVHHITTRIRVPATALRLAGSQRPSGLSSFSLSSFSVPEYWNKFLICHFLIS